MRSTGFPRKPPILNVTQVTLSRVVASDPGQDKSKGGAALHDCGWPVAGDCMHHSGSKSTLVPNVVETSQK